MFKTFVSAHPGDDQTAITSIAHVNISLRHGYTFTISMFMPLTNFLGYCKERLRTAGNAGDFSYATFIFPLNMVDKPTGKCDSSDQPPTREKTN